MSLYPGYEEIKSISIDKLDIKDGFEVLDVFQSEVLEDQIVEQVHNDKDGNPQVFEIKHPYSTQRAFAVIGRKPKNKFGVVE